MDEKASVRKSGLARIGTMSSTHSLVNSIATMVRVQSMEWTADLSHVYQSVDEHQVGIEAQGNKH